MTKARPRLKIIFMLFFNKFSRAAKAAILTVLFAVTGVFSSCDNSSDMPFIPIVPQQKKKSDWLFLLYFDADDPNINDDLYKNMRDIECAFAKTRNADGSPKKGYASVTALVLWDGISDEAKGEDQRFIHADGELYEIGADYTLSYIPQKGNKYGAGYVDLADGFSVGANTKRLTEAARWAGWLAKEPNMSDSATFTNFLKWAKARYEAPNVVVCLQDHGAGTYKETYTDSTAISKTLCVDATNGGDRELTCKNITDALKAAGWTGRHKPKILWNDLCLQGTAEIVWNYRGCADYYCSSPNISCMPDYYGVFSNIKSGMTALDVGKVMVSAYFERYYNELIDCPKDEKAAKNSRASGCSMFTSSFISLDEQKVGEFKTAVDKFAKDLLAMKEADEELFKDVFRNCLAQNINSLPDCKGLTYSGTYAFLSDLGWLCNDICASSSWDGTAAKTSADNLCNLLEHGDDKLIIYAWGGKRAGKQKTAASGELEWDEVTSNQMYLTGQKDFISQETIACERLNKPFGLTIVGSVWGGMPKEYNTVLHYDDWTGFSSKWGKVLNAWLY